MSTADAGIGPARYSPAVWARFRDPKHVGRPADSRCGRAHSPAHHLDVCLHARRSEAGDVVAAGFSVVGCPTTVAVADYCAERLLAGDIPGAAAIMEALEIPESHRHCVLVCEDALTELRQALEIE